MMREPNQTESPIQEDASIQEDATIQEDAITQEDAPMQEDAITQEETPIQEPVRRHATRASLIDGIEADHFNQLTKRNQQFMVDLDKHLVREELDLAKRELVYQEMVTTLIEGQATSQTARQIYGTPMETANIILDQEIQVQEQAQISPDWQIAVDGGLILGSIFTFFTGLGITLRPGEAEAGFLMGIVTIIINYLVAGYAMLRTSKVMPKLEAPKGERGYGKYFLVSTLSMLAWIGLVMISQVVLPVQLNPVLSGSAYLVIAALTFALRFYLKRKWKIVGGLF